MDGRGRGGVFGLGVGRISLARTLAIGDHDKAIRGDVGVSALDQQIQFSTPSLKFEESIQIERRA